MLPKGVFSQPQPQAGIVERRLFSKANAQLEVFTLKLNSNWSERLTMKPKRVLGSFLSKGLGSGEPRLGA
jgi:hypothetical protein